jgi:ABC-type nitrate/sulfonate/bicarbonate transport system substrate-binding protein
MQILRNREPLRIGYLPLSDCAPLVYASEAGLFAQYELNVELQREIRWGDLRDKVISGDLDAAQAPAPLPFLANVGVDSDHCSCVSGMVTNLQGSAITVSRKLWDEGVSDAAGLKSRIYANWGKKTYTFAFSHTFSAQHHLLEIWLRRGGAAPDRGIRLVAMPPAQLYPTLKLGYIDGYCIGEPWTSMAVQSGAGVCVATSAELAPLHPEKVLMVRQGFAIGRAQEHEQILAALLEACAFCDRPENWPVVAEILCQRQYVDAPVECFPGVVGAESPRRDQQRIARGLDIFHRSGANAPTDDKAAWIVEMLYGLLQKHSLDWRQTRPATILKNVFRRDSFERGQALWLQRPQYGAHAPLAGRRS